MADQLSGGAKCVKYTLFLFNMLFLLAGLGLIVIGAIVVANTNEGSFDSNASYAGIFIIVIGGIAFVVAFFGCAGAINDNHCMVITYAILLIILLLAEIAGVVTGFVLRDQLTDTIMEEMTKTQAEYDERQPNNPAVITWNSTQHDFECCGTNGYLSWNASKSLAETYSVPDSCCKIDIERCGYGKYHSKIATEIFYEKGCYDAVVDHLKYYLVAVGAIAGAVALLELIGIVFACCLAGHLRKDYRVV